MLAIRVSTALHSSYREVVCTFSCWKAAMTSRGHLQSAFKQVLFCPRGPIGLVLNFTHSWVLLLPVMLDLEQFLFLSCPVSASQERGLEEAIIGSRHGSLSPGPRAGSRPSLGRLSSLEMGVRPLFFISSPLHLYPNSMSGRGGEERR